MKLKYGVCQWCIPIKGPDGCDAAAVLGLDGIEMEYSDELIHSVGEYVRRKRDLGIELHTLGMNVFCRHAAACRPRLPARLT